MSVTIAQLRALVATVEQGSFTRAAAALGIGQSAVSHALAGLEREIGGPVVDRRGQSEPTALGMLLLDHAHAVLGAVDALEASVRPATVRGTVRLAAVPTVCQGLLPRLRAVWSVRLPHVDVQVYEGDDDEMPEWLDGGTVDAAVLVDPDPVPEGGVVVAEDEMAAVVRADHPLAHTPSMTLQEVHVDGLVAGGGGCERQIERMHRIADVPYTYAHRVRDMSTVFGMIERGEGVGIVPTLGRVMLPTGLVMVPMTTRLERRLVLSGPGDRPWHPLVRALVDAVA